MKKTICFLLLCITGILFSCKEDDGVLNPHSHEKSHQTYKRTIVSFDDMKAKIEANSGQSIALFNHLASKGGEDYIQEIDTTYIIEYTNDTLTTYTMRVITLDEENYSYSNLIVKTINGETQELIAHYTPTPEWQAAHDTGDYLPYDGLVEVTDIYGTRFGEDPNVEGKGKITCKYSIETIYVENPCNCGNPVVSSYVLWVDCSDGGGGGGNNPWGGDGGGPFDENGQGNLPTDPVGGGGGPVVTAFNSEFLVSLTQSQIDWLDANQAILSQIYTYLQTYGQPHPNGWYDNPAAVQFAQWAVGYLMNNPNYNFNDLLWIQNLGFSNSEKYYIFGNATLVTFVNGLMLQNDIDLDSKQRIAGLYVAFEVANANNTLNSLSQNPLYDYFWDKIEEYISSAAYNGAAKAFRIMHRLYWGISQTTDPNKINNWNIFVIDPMRSAVANSNYVNMTPNTMSWKDVLLIWLFELGNYPNIHAGHPTLQFGSGANVINGTANIDGIKNHNSGVNSVGFARNDVKGAITNNNIHSGARSYYWHFNTQAFSNFISNPNYMEFTLGSYNTSINWYSLTGNTNYNFMFNIKNITGWNSATRGVNGTYIIPDKPRGQGIHLGGTIAETFIWTELFTH